MGKVTDLITVCASCQQASCWQGEFYCDEYKTANIKQMTRGELTKLALEHPSYWKTDAEWATVWDADARKWNDERREWQGPITPHDQEAE